MHVKDTSHAFVCVQFCLAFKTRQWLFWVVRKTVESTRTPTHTDYYSSYEPKYECTIGPLGIEIQPE